MALQGTLDTFALADVLRLLAATAKTGRLAVDSDRGPGSVWLQGGAVVAGEVDADADDTVGVVFQLLRAAGGSFEFLPDEEHGSSHDGQPVDEVIAGAEARLAAWREVEAVVPSLLRIVAPVAELPADEVVVDRARWSTLVAVGEGRSVAEVGERMGLGEIPVSEAVRALVDAGLAVVSDDEVAPDVAPEVDEAPEPTTGHLFDGAPDTPADTPSDALDDGIFDDLVAELDREDELDERVRAELDVDGAGFGEPVGSTEVALDADLDADADEHDYIETAEDVRTIPEPLLDPGKLAEVDPLAPAVTPRVDAPTPGVVGAAESDIEFAAFDGFEHDVDDDHTEDEASGDAGLTGLSPKAAQAIAAAAADGRGKGKAKGAKGKPEEPMNRTLLQKFISSK